MDTDDENREEEKLSTKLNTKSILLLLGFNLIEESSYAF